MVFLIPEIYPVTLPLFGGICRIDVTHGKAGDGSISSICNYCLLVTIQNLSIRGKVQDFITGCLHGNLCPEKFLLCLPYVSNILHRTKYRRQFITVTSTRFNPGPNP